MIHRRGLVLALLGACLAACATPIGAPDQKMSACPDLWRTKYTDGRGSDAVHSYGLRLNRGGDLLPPVYADLMVLSPRLLAVRDHGDECFTFHELLGEEDRRQLGRSWTTTFTGVQPAPLLLGVRPAERAGEHVFAVLRADGSVACELVGARDRFWGLGDAVVWHDSEHTGVVVDRRDGSRRTIGKPRFVPTGPKVGRILHELPGGLSGLLQADGTDWNGGVDGFLGLRGLDWGNSPARKVGSDAWLLVSRGEDGGERLAFVTGDFAQSFPERRWVAVETLQRQHDGRFLSLLVARGEDGTWETAQVFRHEGVDGTVVGQVWSIRGIGTGPDRGTALGLIADHLKGLEEQRWARLAAEQAERDSLDGLLASGQQERAREIAFRWGGDLRAKYFLRWPGTARDLKWALDNVTSPVLRKQLQEVLTKVERQEAELARQRAAELAQRQEADRKGMLLGWGDALIAEWQRGTQAPQYEGMSLSEQWFGRTIYRNGVAYHTSPKEVEDYNHRLRLDHERRSAQYGTLDQFLRGRLGGQYEEYARLAAQRDGTVR